jgi:hypothetical protein
LLLQIPLTVFFVIKVEFSSLFAGFEFDSGGMQLAVRVHRSLGNFQGGLLCVFVIGL